MFTFEYNHTDYAKLISDMAKNLQVQLKNDTVIIPGDIANGYYKYIPLTNGLQCMISDITLNEDVYIRRKATDKEFYVLRFDEISISDKLMVKIDNDYIWEDKQNRASVFLTSSLYDFAHQATKGTAIKSINVLITRKWREQYLDIKSMDKVLEKYLELKTASYSFAPIDIEYGTLVKEVRAEWGAIMKGLV